MFLTKLELNPRSREARRDLAQPYELHRTLAHAFSTPVGNDYRAAHGVLFRVEPASNYSALPTVLVQSANAPNWEGLPINYLRQPAQCKPIALILNQGQVLGFRLMANPTKKVAREGQRQGKRVPLLNMGGSDEELPPAQQWLRRKAELSGFEVLHVISEAFTLHSESSVAASRSLAKQHLPLYGVRFDGLLRVQDPQRLIEVLAQGLGPAKSFGFGLLSLAPAAS